MESSIKPSSPGMMLSRIHGIAVRWQAYRIGSSIVRNGLVKQAMLTYYLCPLINPSISQADFIWNELAFQATGQTTLIPPWQGPESGEQYSDWQFATSLTGSSILAALRYKTT